MSAIIQLRSRQRPLYRPAAVEASADCASLHSKGALPLAHCARNPVMREGAARAPVVGLVTPARPSAVCGFVAARVVDSFNGQKWRRMSHVGQKAREAVPPPITDFDAARTVVRPLFVPWVLAPIFHLRPTPINGSLKQAMLSNAVSLQAAARRGVPSFKMLQYDGSEITTVASTGNSRVFDAAIDRRFNEFEDEKASELLANGVAHDHGVN